MGDETSPKVIIGGKVFLYRQKAPYVPSGKSVLGALEYDDAEDKVRCHECGEWFTSISGHLSAHDGLLSREYKQRHGLRSKSALIGEKLRATRSAATAEANAKRGGAFFETEAGKATLRARGAAMVGLKMAPYKRHELKNERGHCHAQLLSKIRAVAEKLGRTPTMKEFAANGVSIMAALRAFNLTAAAQLMSLAKLSPNKRGRRRHSREEFVEILRDFYAAHKRLPTRSDYRRGLLPSSSAFIREFGSMTYAYWCAGLEEVAQQDWRRRHRRQAVA